MITTINCPLCSSDNLHLITNTVRFGYKADVYSCSKCKLTFLDPNSFQYPKDFYEREYHQTYLTHVEPDAFNPQKYYEKMLKSTKVWADRFSKHLKGTEKILDVGCSTGHFLQLIQGNAGTVYGHELNKKEIAFCQEQCGLDVSDKPLEKRFEKGFFDYITMIYVLEHIGDPIYFLNYLKQFLKKDGKFVILVPCYSDPLVKFYDIQEFKNFYYCIEHLFYYTDSTIKLIFDHTNLSGNIELLQEYPITNHINWGYLKVPSDTLSSRKGIPDIALNSSVPMAEWKELWEKFNQLYKEFLQQHNYGDRLWCTIKQNNL